MPVLSIRRGATAMGQAHIQSSLAPAQGAEIWYGPVQACQPQKTFHETCGLPERHPEQDFHRQPRLDGSVTGLLLPTTLTAWWRHPVHPGIKPDRKRSASLQCGVVRRSVRGLILRWGSAAHPPTITLYSRDESPHTICVTCIIAPCARGIFRADSGASSGADMYPAS